MNPTALPISPRADTAQLARFSNVWINLETTASLAVAKPGVFERVMAGLIGQAGEGALDRIVWASGASVLHPEPPLRWLWERFQFSQEMREREGLPEITKEIKRKILGLNYLPMHGLDAETLAQNIEGDEFAVERSKRESKAVRDQLRERVCKVTAFSKEDVISRLYEMIDPCSAATSVPLSIVEMGMVENVELASGNVVVAISHDVADVSRAAVFPDGSRACACRHSWYRRRQMYF
jgi:hypothetical protein